MSSKNAQMTSPSASGAAHLLLLDEFFRREGIPETILRRIWTLRDNFLMLMIGTNVPLRKTAAAREDLVETAQRGDTLNIPVTHLAVYMARTDRRFESPEETQELVARLVELGDRGPETPAPLLGPNLEHEVGTRGLAIFLRELSEPLA